MWTPNHIHTHFSLLDGLSKPEQIAKKCANYGYKACTLTDHGNISSAVKFAQEMKKVGVKPILGCEFYINRNDAKIHNKENGQRQTDHLVILAKNLQGWKTLMKMVSRANDEDVFYYKPRLDFQLLQEYMDGNLIACSGHPGSYLANCLYENFDSYNGKLQNEALSLGIVGAQAYEHLFGKGNFNIEIQLIDKGNTKCAQVIADILREVSVKTGIPCIACADSHYPEHKDAVDQQVLLCSALKTTFNHVQSDIANGEEVGLGGFFKSTNFHLPSPEEIFAVNTTEEIANTELLASLCEDYSILNKPDLPSFMIPSGESQDEYLRQLCREGWKNKLENRGIIDNPAVKQEYLDRIKMELGVIEKAKLAGYFLIVQDYISWCKKQGWLIGPGRGSAAGCLISYLSGITLVDPIPNKLLFSRFYNAGRNTGDHIEYPDIDVDVPIEKRDRIITYLKDKYGNENVAQICTFGRLRGRQAIKEVLRVHDACSFDMMNKITAGIPDESKIADKMEEDQEESIIRWILENEPANTSDYCRLTDDGKFEGEYAMYFEQAVRLEGTYKSCGKHAAGVVIGSHPLNEICPMVRSARGEEKITGFEMNDCAAIGLIKLDVLGVAALDKLMYVNTLLKG